MFKFLYLVYRYRPNIDKSTILIELYFFKPKYDLRVFGTKIDQNQIIWSGFLLKKLNYKCQFFIVSTCWYESHVRIPFIFHHHHHLGDTVVNSFMKYLMKAGSMFESCLQDSFSNLGVFESLKENCIVFIIYVHSIVSMYKPYLKVLYRFVNI